MGDSQENMHVDIGAKIIKVHSEAGEYCTTLRNSPPEAAFIVK